MKEKKNVNFDTRKSLTKISHFTFVFVTREVASSEVYVLTSLIEDGVLSVNISSLTL